MRESTLEREFKYLALCHNSGILLEEASFIEIHQLGCV